MKTVGRFFLLAWLLLPAAVCAESSDELLNRLVPQGWVSDFAGIFTPSNRAALDNRLKEVQDKTTAQIFVVTLKSLEGGEINDFANRLFQKWKIGQKGKDNGLLLIMAVEDRKVRIEVGYWLEGALPDAKTGRILDEQVIPWFKNGQIAEGLTHGADYLAVIAANEAGVALTNLPPELAAAASATNAAAAADDTISGIIALIFFFIIVGIVILSIVQGWGRPGGRGRRGSWRSGWSSGGGGFSGGGGGSSGGGGASRSW